MREKSREGTELDRELARVRQALRICIMEADMTLTEVAEKSGMKVGVLSVVLRGDRPLKLWELLAILRAVGKAPQTFFGELYGDPRGSRSEGLGPMRRRGVYAGSG